MSTLKSTLGNVFGTVSTILEATNSAANIVKHGVESCDAIFVVTDNVGETAVAASAQMKNNAEDNRRARQLEHAVAHAKRMKEAEAEMTALGISLDDL